MLPQGIVAVLSLVAVGCGPLGTPTAERACGHVVVSDWADGSIDRRYPAACHLEALETLPEDVRAYSTAADDISRALHSRRSGP